MMRTESIKINLYAIGVVKNCIIDVNELLFNFSNVSSIQNEKVVAVALFEIINIL